MSSKEKLPFRCYSVHFTSRKSNSDPWTMSIVLSGDNGITILILGFHGDLYIDSRSITHVKWK